MNSAVENLSITATDINEEIKSRIIVGSCCSMCPESEIKDRENMLLIHRLESANEPNDPEIERQRTRKLVDL